MVTGVQTCALPIWGRYDGLVETLGGPATPAVGFALGVERLFLAIAAEADGTTAVQAREGVGVIALGEDAQRGAFGLTQKLRLAGLKCQMDLDGRSLKAQMRQADRSNFRYAVILGSTELANGTASVKDLASSDIPQREVPLAGLIDFFKNAN
jgi:histidyl-tRNA synthetase